MARDFFKVCPLNWVDLSPTDFDKWGERVVSEAVLSSVHLSVGAKVREVLKDGKSTYSISLCSSPVRGDFETLEDAKDYAQEILQANLANFIRPVYTAPEVTKVEADTETKGNN